MWIVAIICGIYNALWLSFSTIDRFRKNPTVISLERNYKDWNTTFPACTICPTAKTNEDMAEILNKWYPISIWSTNIVYVFVAMEIWFPKADNISDAESWFSSLTNATYTTFSQLEDYKDAIKPEDYLKAIVDSKFQFNYVLSNSNSDTTDLVQTITELGLCYSYNSKLAIYNHPEYWRQKNFTLIPGGDLFKGNPLEGDIFAQIMEMNSGYKMFIHSPYEVSDIATSPRDSPEKYYLELSLVALTTYSTEQTKGLTISQRKCRFLEESNLKISPAYSYKLCKIECRIKLSYKLCECVPYFYRKLDYKICDVKGMQCLGKHKERLIKLMENGEKENCPCLPPCNDVIYSIQADRLSPWFLGTNFKYGLIKYPRSRLKRDVFFTFSDLLVQFGGTAGLCLGCSVLSCMELAYFFTLRLILFILKRANTRPVRPWIRHK